MSAKQRKRFSGLKRSGPYHRLRASLLYDLYLVLTNREILHWRRREMEFYRALLGRFEPGSPIFDIGANTGDKIDTFLRLGARVIAVDPDENNQAILRQRFLRYRLIRRPVTIVAKAVGAQAGKQTMLICGPGSVFNTLSSKGAGISAEALHRHEFGLDVEYQGRKNVETTTLELLIETYGLPALIKIDVVGFELEVLQGLHRAVPCLSFEIDLPGFREELVQCVEILGGLSADGQFNYTWNRGKGLALERWLDLIHFLRLLDGFGEGPLEVFWRTVRE